MVGAGVASPLPDELEVVMAMAVDVMSAAIEDVNSTGDPACKSQFSPIHLASQMQSPSPRHRPCPLQPDGKLHDLVQLGPIRPLWHSSHAKPVKPSLHEHRPETHWPRAAPPQSSDVVHSPSLAAEQ